MPPRVKPIIFGWPGGTLFRYQKAIAKAESTETTQDICRVIEDLLKAGISKIHLLCHSMGARVILQSCPQFSKYFYSKRMTSYNQDSVSSQKAILSSVTFMNPEASLSRFKTESYEIIKQFTDLITIYANQKDIALLASEYVFTRESMMGRRINEYVNEGYDGEAAVLDVDIIDTTEMDANVHAGTKIIT